MLYTSLEIIKDPKLAKSVRLHKNIKKVYLYLIWVKLSKCMIKTGLFLNILLVFLNCTNKC